MPEITIGIVLVLAVLAAAAVAGTRIHKKKKADSKKIKAERKYKAYWSKNRVKSRKSREIAYLVHQLVNRERESRGIPGLSYEHHLAFIARGHSRDMAHHNYLGHVNSQGESPTDRARRKGYRFTDGNYIGIGENCQQLWNVGQDRSGKTYRKNPHQLANEAVRGWMNSPGHRSNILNPITRSRGSALHGQRSTGARYTSLRNALGDVVAKVRRCSSPRIASTLCCAC